jgi:hypothetical protein
VHLVAFLEQELGEVGAVLAGDAGDESFFLHGQESKSECFCLACTEAGLEQLIPP